MASSLASSLANRPKCGGLCTHARGAGLHARIKTTSCGCLLSFLRHNIFPGVPDEWPDALEAISSPNTCE
jgi:hypothetical protein